MNEQIHAAESDYCGHDESRNSRKLIRLSVIEKNRKRRCESPARVSGWTGITGRTADQKLHGFINMAGSCSGNQILKHVLPDHKYNTVREEHTTRFFWSS